MFINLFKEVSYFDIKSNQIYSPVLEIPPVLELHIIISFNNHIDVELNQLKSIYDIGIAVTRNYN